MCPYLPILTTTVLSGALVAGCSEQPSPAEPANVPQSSVRPEGSGAQVIRFEAQAIIISDPDRDFSMRIGVPLSNAPECGGTGEVTGATVHNVITPSEISRIVARVRQQEMVLYDHFTEDFCGLSEDDVVARGRGNADLRILTRTPNTLFAIQATGTVELTSGGLAHLTVKGQFHIEPDGSLRVHVDRFRLQPIGG